MAHAEGELLGARFGVLENQHSTHTAEPPSTKPKTALIRSRWRSSKHCSRKRSWASTRCWWRPQSATQSWWQSCRGRGRPGNFKSNKLSYSVFQCGGEAAAFVTLQTLQYFFMRGRRNITHLIMGKSCRQARLILARQNSKCGCTRNWSKPARTGLAISAVSFFFNIFR